MAPVGDRGYVGDTRRTTALLWSLLALLVAASPLGAADAKRCGGKEADIVGKKGQERINGTDGPDVILGGPDTREIDGGAGRDTICAGPDGTLIIGGRGGDTLIGGRDPDDFVADTTDGVAGGERIDTVYYGRERAAGVEVDLASGVVRSVVDVGGGPSGSIEEVERVSGTDFADDLRGDPHDNGLSGEGGNDFVDGRGGDDLFYGGPGRRDEVSYATAPARVRTAEAGDTGDSWLTGRVGSDTDTIRSFAIVTGSDHNDLLKGTDEPERFYGGKGDDTLVGYESRDRLFGGGGNDRFAPGPGDDFVDGGDNGPVTGTRQPGDLVNYKNGELEGGHDGMEVHLDLTLPPPESPFEPRPRYHAVGEGNDIVTQVESVRGMEGAFNFIYGDDGPNVLVGGKKGDHLESYGGNDFLFGLGGSDAVYGGDGDDYLDPGGEAEITDGGNGTDTCVGVHEDFRLDCEKNPSG